MLFIKKSVFQYWPLTIVTIALVWGLPFMTGQGENRPGLAGITGGGGGLSTDADDELLRGGLIKAQAGYTRPAGILPFYGFDSLQLSTPLFKSWWEGKSATAAAKLHELHANTVVLGQIWKDGLTFHDTVARMRGAGVRVIVEVTDMSDWVDVRDDMSGHSQPVPNTFVPGRALRVLAEANKAGVGHFADFIMIGGDAMTFATQLQRQKMYQVVKGYFPTTPVVRRYALELDKADALLGKPHPMGGLWDDYRFGPDECDIALVSVGRGLDDTRAGVRIKAALEELNHIVSIVKSRAGDAAIVVTAKFGDEHVMNNNRTAMWSPKEIDQFVSAILTSAAVDGLLFHGLGDFTYDLGSPEFPTQRDAFRDAAPAVSPGEAVADSTQVSDRNPASEK